MEILFRSNPGDGKKAPLDPETTVVVGESGEEHENVTVDDPDGLGKTDKLIVKD
jgi:hypothetical protein